MPLRSLLAIALLAAAASAGAQTYPAKPVKLIVPWPPAGVSDILARALAQGMTGASGQPVIALPHPRPRVSPPPPGGPGPVEREGTRPQPSSRQNSHSLLR